MSLMSFMSGNGPGLPILNHFIPLLYTNRKFQEFTNNLSCLQCKLICVIPISYLVYSVNYPVCLLITTKTNQVGEYNTSAC